MKSVMKHSFSEVPKVETQRSVFNRSHGYKTTFDAGYLVPFFVDLAYPGDTFNINATVFARLATPIVPIMDNLHLDTFYFSVPIRLVWDNFTKMMGEQATPTSSIDYVFPVTESPAVTGFAVGSLYDYFGIPTGVPGLEINNIFARAYNLIWNEWFKAQSIQSDVVVDKGDADDDPTDYVLLRRGKRFDYFTACLPEPQKGDAVELPLGGSAPVVDTGSTLWLQDATGARVGNFQYSTTTVNHYVPGGTSTLLNGDGNLRYLEGLETDLSTATAATINSLREAFAIQKMLEKDARGGTRYVEVIKSHFNVTTPSQGWRSEYLGGNSTPVNIHTVPQTSETNTTPQGNLSAYGTCVSSKNGFVKSFTEHCIVIGMTCVHADLTYQQGIPRMFSYSTRYDMYFPSLAHLGEQAVLTKEIYADGSATDETVFGYIGRYDEMRYFPSKITGQLRSTYAQSLDVWHLSQEFSSAPTLSNAFIVENPPVARVIAVNEPHFIFDSYIDFKAVRPMPTYNVPGLIDHF